MPNLTLLFISTAISVHETIVSINPFATDGTQKCRFEKFFKFSFGRGAQISMSDATMRR